MIHFKDNKNKSPLNTRWAQMTKQEQIIERKKIEIQAKLEAQKQAAALAAQAKLANPASKDDKNIFSNDGSFMSQFKALLEKQKQEKEETEQKERQKSNEDIKDNDKDQESNNQNEEEYDNEFNDDEKKKSGERSTPRDKQCRWTDKGRNQSPSPGKNTTEDRKNHFENKSSSDIPPLMKIPVRIPEDNDSEPWRKGSTDSNSNQDSNDQNFLGPNQMLPGPMPPGPMSLGPLPPRMMGPGMMGPGPPGMGPGPNMGPGPILRPGGPNMPPMPPFMGGHPNFPMPPNFMGPRPCGSMPPNMCGPNGPMPPFFGPPFPNPGMMGPNGLPNSMGGPNGPPNSMMGPNGPPNSMMGPNGPPNRMMRGPNGPLNPMMGPNGPPNSINNSNMPFMGPRPPFGPNGPNFNNGNAPPNMPPFMPPTSMRNIPDSKTLDGPNQAPESMKLPMTLSVNHLPKPKDLESGHIPPPQSSQVLSADSLPPSVAAAAAEVANNGDHWENVLKAIHTQDHKMWFLHNTNSNEYKKFRELVNKLRSEKKPEIKDEDKYEPEFSLEDDDSYDAKPNVKEENSNSNTSSSCNYWNTAKREQASSQSDEEPETKRETRKRKKKSRWGDDAPVDIKPPGMLAPAGPESIPPVPGTMPPIPGTMLPMPGSMPVIPGTMPPMPIMPGAKLAKVDEEGLKLSTVNRNNHALMQYAMTNYGTTNLSAEDWKKCEDNFKLNLLYQDMLKKRQEVERLAAAGKHKYEYDSDEDTSEGTWEHKLRAREMYATEKWADELTKQAAGKHHIGDFLPPEELKKFMEKYSAVKSGKEPDLSDYKEFKLKEDNVGFKMLQKLGWSEGQGLGIEGSGIVDPINKANQPVANLGLGASTSDGVSPEDDEFDAYRKRMMLAYRFRPNPLNNPRRPYY